MIHKNQINNMHQKFLKVSEFLFFSISTVMDIITSHNEH